MTEIRPERIPIPTNEFGIVMPPETKACKGEGCSDRNGYATCGDTLHHLHSSKPVYTDAGHIATKFRELDILTVWLPRCVHTEHHYAHEIDIPPPSLEVMQECIADEKKIRKLVMSKRELQSNDRIIQRPDTDARQRSGLLRRREQLLVSQTEYLQKVLAIDILPEHLITGALILAAPDEARLRIAQGSKVVLPGVIRRNELSDSSALAQEFISAADALQTGVNTVQLAA